MNLSRSVRVGVSGDVFQGADGGGPHGDDAVAASPRRVDCLGRVLGELEPLGVDFVLGDVFAVDRAEGIEADVEGQPRCLNTFRADEFKERLGEMQPCSGSRDAAGSVRVNGLIAVGIIGCFLNVRRQGKFAQAVQSRVVAYTHQAETILLGGQHFHIRAA